MRTEKNKDTDYLYISARLKAQEKLLVSKEKLSRLAFSRTSEEAVKLLTDNGWSEFNADDLASLETQIDVQREQMFELLYRYAPDSALVDVFRLKYDYHNMKAMIKGQAMSVDVTNLLSTAGTINIQRLQTIFREKSYHELNPIMRDGLLETIDVLSRTADPQLCDLTLDNAMHAQMLEAATLSGSVFLINYVRLFIDLANLRVLIRGHRAAKSFDFLRRAISEGGSVSPQRLYGEVSAEIIALTFAAPDLLAAGNIAAEALSGNISLGDFDKACDDALIGYIKSARFIAFGEAHIIAYIIGFEAQLTAIRMVMAGRVANLDPEKIIERLRVSYV